MRDPSINCMLSLEHQNACNMDRSDGTYLICTKEERLTSTRLDSTRYVYRRTLFVAGCTCSIAYVSLAIQPITFDGPIITFRSHGCAATNCWPVQTMKWRRTHHEPCQIHVRVEIVECCVYTYIIALHRIACQMLIWSQLRWYSKASLLRFYAVTYI